MPLPNDVNNIKKLFDLPWQCAPFSLLNGSFFSLVGQFQILEEEPVGGL
jgi:hypothetical protein